ncbi:MAG: 5'-nucleotidase [Zestosphaera sp.]
MPVEVYDKSKFIEISSRAELCRVVRREKEGIAKVKARTKKYLYTIKIPINELEEFIKQLKCKELVEIGKGS